MRGRALLPAFPALAVLAGLAGTAPALAEEAPVRSPARGVAGETASEHWDLSVRLDSGHLVFARFLVTNLGVGDRNAAALGHVVAPDGRVTPFRNGRREGRWSLEREGLRVDIGSSELDQSGDAPLLSVDKDRVRIELDAGPLAEPPTSAPDGSGFQLQATAARVRGTLWLEGMERPLPVSGRLGLIHRWQAELDSERFVRRLEFFSLDPEAPLFLAEELRPSGQRRVWMATGPGRVLAARSADAEGDGNGTGAGRTAGGDPGYTVPAAVSLEVPGAHARLDLSRPLLRYDPLSDLPMPFRWMVGLWMRPRHFWTQARFRVELPAERRGEARTWSGLGIASLSFPNPLDDRLAAADGAPQEEGSG